MAKEQKEEAIEKKPIEKEPKKEQKKAKVDVDAFIARKLKIANNMDSDVQKESIARKLYNNK